MADTQTPNLGLTIQTQGGNNNTWGIIANTNFEYVDARFGDVTEVTTVGGTTVLLAGQERCAGFDVNGTLAANAVIEFSGAGGSWVVANNTAGDYILTVKVGAGSGVVVPQGGAAVVWFDGTDMDLAVKTSDVAAEVTIASATTTDVAGAASEYVAVSGTASITSLGTGPTRRRHVRATGAFTLVHHASTLILPGAQNIKAEAGDTFTVIFDASSNARIVQYQRAAVPPPYIPVGIGPWPYGGDTAPPFYLFSYGQAVSRTTYAALFAVYGVKYGAGDGVSTFNLPDTRGRVIAGNDNLGGTPANRVTAAAADTIGGVFGADKHQLTVEELAAHRHFSFVDADGTATQNDLTASNRPARARGSGGNDSARYIIVGLNDEPTVGQTSQSGGDQSHNNVQPTLFMPMIIYAGA